MVNNQFSDFIDDVVSSLVLGKEYQANVQIEKGRGRRYGNEIDDCTRSYSILLESKPINTYEVTGITIDPNVIDDDNREELATLLQSLGDGVRRAKSYAGINISDSERGYFTLTKNPNEIKTDLSRLMGRKYPAGNTCTKELTAAAIEAYPQFKDDPVTALTFYTNAHQD